MGKFNRVVLVRDSPVGLDLSGEARSAPLGAVVTAVLLNAPRRSFVVGSWENGRLKLLVRERTWVEQYG